MRADYRVLIDACVLANHGVCDLLLQLAEKSRFILPCWSAEILAEVRRTHLEKLGWPARLVDSFQEQVQRSFPEATISGYESLTAELSNDPKDRHVLAAAIRGGCDLILTSNLKHFRPESLTRWAIRAAHPQDYLLVLHEMEPQQVAICLGEMAGRRQMAIEDLLIQLGRVLPRFASRVLDELGAA